MKRKRRGASLVKQADLHDSKGRKGLTEREELNRLRREHKSLLEEREILEKAKAFVAKHRS